MRGRGEVRKIRGRYGTRRRRAQIEEDRRATSAERDSRMAAKPLPASGADRREARCNTNWRIIHDKVTGNIIALEPGREYEDVFTGGPDPFGEALEYAAAELRKGHRDQRDDQPA